VQRNKKGPNLAVRATFWETRSASFFGKKAAKILLFAWEMGHRRCHIPHEQKFFGSFFQKRTACFL
jgi:hypothetical protein